MDRTSTQWVKTFISCTIPLSLLAPCALVKAATVVPVHIVFYEDLVKGKVTDEKGQPLPGVTVRLKYSTKAVQTDSDGYFAIAAEPGKNTLVFSFIGLKTRELTITDEQLNNVVLTADPANLSDAVVFAYYSQEKRNVTQAVAKMTADQLRTPANNFDQLMSGRMAGLNVTNSSGLVGEAPVVRVRGASSISATSSSYPLVVIDGVPVITGNSAGLFTYNPLNALSAINPADIESIQLLKDAASAAIYGSRAAAGVLLVTTKRGVKGGQINYGADLGLVQPGNELTVLNAEQYNTTINKMRANAGQAPLAAYGTNGDGSTRIVNTDWQDELYHNGVVQQHQLSFSGGSDTYNYYGSGSVYHYDNYLRNNGMDRASGRLNASSKVKEWLTAGINMQFSRSMVNGISRVGGTQVNSIPRSFFTYFPNVWTHNDDGSYYHGRGGNSAPITAGNFPNPLSALEMNYEKLEVRKFLGSIFLEANPMAGLTLRTQFNTDLTNNTENHYWHPKTNDGVPFNGISSNAFGNSNIWSWYSTARYETYIGEHHLNALAGVEYTRRKNRSLRPFAYGQKEGAFDYFSPENFTTFGAGVALFDYNDGLASYFAGLQYDFQGKYFATANFRADYNSAFIGRNKRGLFPALSGGWRLSQEDFLKSSKVLNDLKLRASYGLTGNANVGYFPASATYQYLSYADSSALNISTPGNADLRWEKSRQLNIGADASLWNGLLNVTTDWFVKNSKDLILTNPILSTVGLPGNNILQNMGQLRTQGVELTVQATPVKSGKWRWQSDWNISYVKNKVITTNGKGDQINEGYGLAKPGEELGTYYLLRFAGVDDATGRAIYLNKDGQQRMYNPAAGGSWTDPATGQAATGVSGADKVALSGKTPYPKLYGGFYNTVSYGGIDLTLGLQYAFDFYVYNQILATLMDNTNAYNKSAEVLKSWKQAGQQAVYPAMYWGDAASWQESTQWLEKGNFVRVREITLGYKLPATVLQHVKLDRVRIYAQAQNPFLFTKYKGMDPEANANGNVNIGMGIDSFRPFIAKTFMAGIQISL